VSTPATALGIVTLGEVKAHLLMTATETPNDAALQQAIDAVTKMLERRGYSETKEYTQDVYSPRSVIILSHYPVVAIVSVTAYSGGVPRAYALADPTAAPANDTYTANLGGGLVTPDGSWPYGSTVRVVYTAGYTGDPDLAWAVKEQVRRWFMEPYGLGSETYGPADAAARLPAQAAGLDPDVEAMLPVRVSQVG
jgi:hypothetical protein